MSYAIVWEFAISADVRPAFEAAYGPTGAWATLFRKAAGFIEVRLLRCMEREERYVTIDRWESREAFEAFRDAFAAEYEVLDSRFEKLGAREARIGGFLEITPDA